MYPSIEYDCPLALYRVCGDGKLFTHVCALVAIRAAGDRYGIGACRYATFLFTHLLFIFFTSPRRQRVLIFFVSLCAVQDGKRCWCEGASRLL